MDDILNWISANPKQAGGIGVALAAGIAAVWKWATRDKTGISQSTQGSQSPAINAGGDVDISYGDKPDAQ
ncbi:MAG: hypothetical protein HWE25_16935 [Alphaproteobacteria bacterium]|nr:hypothetical protein [Alphaproteobacteria bacterium]